MPRGLVLLPGTFFSEIGTTRSARSDLIFYVGLHSLQSDFISNAFIYRRIYSTIGWSDVEFRFSYTLDIL